MMPEGWRRHGRNPQPSAQTADGHPTQRLSQTTTPPAIQTTPQLFSSMLGSGPIKRLARRGVL